MPTTPPLLFSYAFRPLFIGALVSAMLFISWWVLAHFGYVGLPSLAMPALYWHSHEMLFGFVGAAIGGFLLTAIANWTGRPPVSGRPLLMLCLCWLCGRLAMASSGLLPYGLVAAVDMSYLLCLILLAGREVVAGGNERNYKILFVLGLLALANLAYHETVLISDQVGTAAAIRATLLIVSLLIAIIGGRIIPNFTRNWLNRRAHEKGQEKAFASSPTATPPNFNNIDKAVLGITLVLLPLWVVWPTAQITGIWALLTGAAHALRLSRWCGLATRTEPLLLILHVGYSWLAIGFSLLGIMILLAQAQSPAVHALSAGAMMTMILAVAARAALGHTNREVSSSPPLTLCFALITLGAAMRVLAIFTPFYGLLLAASAVTTLLALGLFSWIYLPILLQPAIAQELPIAGAKAR